MLNKFGTTALMNTHTYENIHICFKSQGISISQYCIVFIVFIYFYKVIIDQPWRKIQTLKALLYDVFVIHICPRRNMIINMII